MKNFKLIKRFQIQKRPVMNVKKVLKTFFFSMKSSLKKKKNKKKKNIIRFKLIQSLYLVFYKKIFLGFKRVKKCLNFLWKWSRPNYYPTVNYMIFMLFSIRYNLTEFLLLLHRTVHSWVLEDFWKGLQKVKLSEQQREESFFCVSDFSVKSLLVRGFAFERRQQRLRKYLFRYWRLRFKKINRFKSKYYKNKRYFNMLIRKLKQKKAKKKKFKNFCKQVHWYIPRYLEIDFKTLRAVCIRYPSVNQVFFGFRNSFKKIVSFYKERAV